MVPPFCLLLVFFRFKVELLRLRFQPVLLEYTQQVQKYRVIQLLPHVCFQVLRCEV